MKIQPQDLNEMIDTASEILGVKVGNSSLIFGNGDKLRYRVPASIFTLIHLFGLKKSIRILLSRKTKKIEGSNLPEDCVVFPLGYNNGVVVASRTENTAVKLVLGDNDSRKLGNEVKAGEILGQLQGILPDVKHHGFHDKGYHWMVQDLWADNRPVHPDEAAAFVNEELAEKLCLIYETAGTKSYHLKDWVSTIEKKASERLKSSEVFGRLKQKLITQPNAKNFNLICTRVHGDLYLKHIHRNRRGWRIIDWGHFEEGNLLEDWLCLELKTNRQRWLKQSFVTRLEQAESTPDFNRMMFYDWPGPVIRSFYGEQAENMESLKLMIYAALLDRLVRIEDLVQADPLEVNWLMSALDAR